jgi:AcrR family transcriptional regulator
MTHKAREKENRQRASSKRSLETRERILDAAERLFARNTFEGASIREIAKAAGVPVALVNFHGGSKEELYFTVVARRADELSDARLDALERGKRGGPFTLRAILDCFIRPYLEKAAFGGPQWPDYARLVAQVSADERWRTISEQCFDPAAKTFIQEMLVLLPDADPREVAAGFVFAVSAMLALATSSWRIDVLGGTPTCAANRSSYDDWTKFLVSYCESGLCAALGQAEGPSPRATYS